MVVYGQKALSVIDLNFNWKKSKITDFISKMDEPRPGIKFELGIQKALEMFIEQGNPNAHRLIVLFTHSPTDATSAELHAIKNELLKANIRLVVVDTGSYRRQLLDVSPNNQDIYILSPTLNVNVATTKVSEIINKGEYLLVLNFTLPLC